MSRVLKTIPAQDRRRHPRMPLQAEVPICGQITGLGKATILNLSEGGAFFVSTQKLPRLSIVSILLDLKGSGRLTECTLTASVVRAVKKANPTGTGYGVEFRNMEPETVLLLRRYIDSHTVNAQSPPLLSPVR